MINAVASGSTSGSMINAVASGSTRRPVAVRGAPGGGAAQHVPMLVYAMNVSVDGFVNDREGGLDWSEPDDELFRFHLAQVGDLGAYLLGRRLYETMLVWETDPSLRANDLRSAFADAWSALPKVVFSRTLDGVGGNARLGTAPLADEVAAALAATDRDVAIGGPELAGAALRLDLVDELRIVRSPVVLGGGTAFLPPVDRALPLDRVDTMPIGRQAVYERFRRRRASRL